MRNKNNVGALVELPNGAAGLVLGPSGDGWQIYETDTGAIRPWAWLPTVIWRLEPDD